MRLPGIQRYSQAMREATERLNKLTLNDLSASLEVFDVGIRHEVGDIVNVTHPVGLTAKPFRLSAPPSMAGPGRWVLPIVEHDPAVYSTAVAASPTYTNAGVLISEADINAGGNLLRNASFEGDIDDDGLADNWTPYSVGTKGTVSYSRIGAGAVHGTYKQRFSATGLGTTASDRAGVYQQVSVLGGQDYVLSAWHGNPTGNPKLCLYIDWYSAGSAFIGSASDVFSTAGTMARASLRVSAPVNAASARVYLWMQANSAGPGLATLDIDAAQFQAGTVLTGYAPMEDDLLAGSVGTVELQAQAATEVIELSGTGPYTDSNTICGITVVLTETTKVVARFTGTMACFNGTGSAKFSKSSASVYYGGTAYGTQSITRNVANGEEWEMNFVCEATLTLGAGTHTIYGRQANHGTATIDASAKFVVNHVEAIKR